MSSINEMIRAHRYGDVVAKCRQMARDDPSDMVAVSGLAKALRALGKYEEALPLYERLHAHDMADEEANRAAPGRAGWREQMACLHWMLGRNAEAMRLMTGLVDGVLDGSISYGDIAGGVTQGLLLYYMGVSAGDDAAQSKALRYLRNRARRSAARMFPGPVARFYLDGIEFPDLLAAATEKRGAARDVKSAIDIARDDLLMRRFVCVALFHDGVKARSRGDEARCMMRMRECCALENPLIEEEWYLARYEVERAERDGA